MNLSIAHSRSNSKNVSKDKNLSSYITDFK